MGDFLPSSFSKDKQVPFVAALERNELLTALKTVDCTKRSLKSVSVSRPRELFDSSLICKKCDINILQSFSGHNLYTDHYLSQSFIQHYFQLLLRNQ